MPAAVTQGVLPDYFCVCAARCSAAIHAAAHDTPRTRSRAQQAGRCPPRCRGRRASTHTADRPDVVVKNQAGDLSAFAWSRATANKYHPRKASALGGHVRVRRVRACVRAHRARAQADAHRCQRRRQAGSRSVSCSAGPGCADSLNKECFRAADWTTALAR